MEPKHYLPYIYQDKTREKTTIQTSVIFSQRAIIAKDFLSTLLATRDFTITQQIDLSFVIADAFIAKCAAEGDLIELQSEAGQEPVIYHIDGHEVSREVYYGEDKPE